jgi:hypothetical protein
MLRAVGLLGALRWLSLVALSLVAAGDVFLPVAAAALLLVAAGFAWSPAGFAGLFFAAGVFFAGVAAVGVAAPAALAETCAGSLLPGQSRQVNNATT